MHTTTIKQRDRLCYKLYESGVGEDCDHFICTRERGHIGDCNGHLVIGDMVPPDAETVMMTCEGYDVAVRVWTTNISDSETDPPTLTDWHWMAYVPVPYDWCTLGDHSTRGTALAHVAQYLERFAEDNPDAAGSWPRCFKCQCKLHGDYLDMDASRHKEGLIGFTRITDPFDVEKMSSNRGIFASCLACGKNVPLSSHNELH